MLVSQFVSCRQLGAEQVLNAEHKGKTNKISVVLSNFPVCFSDSYFLTVDGVAINADKKVAAIEFSRTRL